MPGEVLPRITLISKPARHLCAEARAVIERVARDVGVPGGGRPLRAHPARLAAYPGRTQVPSVDGEQHDYWGVDESRLREALRTA